MVKYDLYKDPNMNNKVQLTISWTSNMMVLQLTSSPNELQSAGSHSSPARTNQLENQGVGGHLVKTFSKSLQLILTTCNPVTRRPWAARIARNTSILVTQWVPIASRH